MGADLVPIAVEFFRDQHGEAGHRALPHLVMGDANGHGIVGSDRDPAVDVGDGGAACARADLAKGMAKPSAKPPLTAAAPTTKERRLSAPPDVIASPYLHRNDARFRLTVQRKNRRASVGNLAR